MSSTSRPTTCHCPDATYTRTPPWCSMETGDTTTSPVKCCPLWSERSAPALISGLLRAHPRCGAPYFHPVRHSPCRHFAAHSSSSGVTSARTARVHGRVSE